MSDLGLLPGGSSGGAKAVNDKGVVVGVSGTADGSHHAAVWRDGRISDLGTLGGMHSEANDVNRHGVVIGSSETLWGDRHACIWDHGRMTDLGTLGDDRAFTIATAVNDRGWVVGYGSTLGRRGRFHAFLWKAGRMTDLGTLVPGAGQSSFAQDIDNRGRIVGGATVDTMNHVPVMWQDGRIRELTDRSGEAFAVNNRGQVAGYFRSGPSSSFLWRRGKLTLIGPVEDSMYVDAHGIDRRGRAVGHANRAFVWYRGRFDWLPGLTTGASTARDISGRGRIVVGASASTPDGLNWHAVVWTRR